MNVEIKGNMQCVRQLYWLKKDWLQVSLLRFNRFNSIYVHEFFAGVCQKHGPLLGTTQEAALDIFPWLSHPVLPEPVWGALQ